MTQIVHNSLTRQVAEFAALLKLDDIPDRIRSKAKLHILDSLGCGIAGADSVVAQRVFRWLAVEHRDGPCRVVGERLHLGPAAAAFANAAAMNVLDFDDGFEIAGKGMGHPGATIVAAALSAPFVRDVSGAEFLTSVVAAYEINNRLTRAMQPSYDRFRQVHGVCQHQSVGAAIVYGKLVGLRPEAFENVIGFAGTLANVPSLRKYNWQRRPLISFKDFNAPAAEAGVRAVQLHECRLIGSKDVLDGDTGLWRMLGSDQFDADALVTGLGEDWMLGHNAVKIYPVCRWMQTALEAFAAIIAQNNFSAREIETVTVHTSAGMAKDFMQYMAEDMIDAQFSFPYAIAAVALGVPVGADWYRPTTMQRSDLRGFERRVHACVDPEIDQLMAGPLRRPSGRVTVRVASREYPSELFEYPSGSAERPVGPDCIVAKFMSNAASVIGMGRAAQCAALCEAIEIQPSARTLIELAALP